MCARVSEVVLDRGSQKERSAFCTWRTLDSASAVCDRPPLLINQVFSSWFHHPLMSTRRPIGSLLITVSHFDLLEPRVCQTVGTLTVPDSRNWKLCAQKKKYKRTGMISVDLLYWLHALLLVWSARRTTELQECSRRAQPTMLLGQTRKVEASSSCSSCGCTMWRQTVRAAIRNHHFRGPNYNPLYLSS